MPSGVTRLSPLFFSCKNWRPFLIVTVTFIDFTRLSPPGECHPAPFLPIRPRLSTVLCTFAYKFVLVWMSPPWRASPGAVRPPSDATDDAPLPSRRQYLRSCFEDTGLQSASSSKYVTPRLITKFGKRAFSHAGPAAWNSLPPDIRAAASQPCRVQETTRNALFNTSFSTC